MVNFTNLVIIGKIIEISKCTNYLSSIQFYETISKYLLLESSEKCPRPSFLFNILIRIFQDIDHFRENLDFTYDEINFAGLPDYIKELKKKGVHFIIILVS